MPNADQRDIEWILHRDFPEETIPSIGGGSWVTIHQGGSNDYGIDCLLAPSDRVAEMLSEHERTLRETNWQPAALKEETGHTYCRFGTDDGLEPLVYVREYRGVRPVHLELSEEFRHFHNLYFDATKGEFLMGLEDGTEEVVGKIDARSCELRLRQLRQFLAIKRMHLVVHFWSWRESAIPVEELPQDELRGEFRDALTNYSYEASPYSRSSDPRVRTLSRVIGKKVVPPLRLERCGIWPFEDEPTYESFIIGTDDEGRPVEQTCARERLADASGANPGAPIDLRPVFFRKGVMTKYLANPKRYTVQDGWLRCLSCWTMRIDNNHQDYVVVALRDLGSLPRSEQTYWQSHNVAPDGSGVSEVNYRRNYLGLWTDAQAPDLVFKAAYERAGEAWMTRHGWLLFRELPEGDEHCLAALHQVTLDDHAEFDRQVANLTKVLVDAINEAELGRRLPDKVKVEKGITKLQRFLNNEGLSDVDSHIEFLRDLWGVRSTGVAHLKGEKYDKVASRLSIGDTGLPKAFDNLLARGSALLDWLREWCEAKQAHACLDADSRRETGLGPGPPQEEQRGVPVR